MSQVQTPGTAVAKTQERSTEFVPLGGRDKIMLSVGIVKSMLVKPTKNGKLPTDQQIMSYIMLCKTRALNPFEGDAFLVGFDGQGGPEFSLITAHQAFMKRAEQHPDFDGMESGVIVKDASGKIVDREGDFFLEDDLLLGGWAAVHFKNKKYPMRDRLTLKSRAKDNQFWKRDPAGQIVKCTEASVLRKAFPTILGGLFLREEEGTRIEQVESQVVPPKPDTLMAGIQDAVVVEPAPETKPEPKPSEKPIDRKELFSSLLKRIDALTRESDEDAAQIFDTLEQNKDLLGDLFAQVNQKYAEKMKSLWGD